MTRRVRTLVRAEAAEDDERQVALEAFRAEGEA